MTCYTSYGQLTTELEHDRLNFFEASNVDATIRYTGINFVIDNNETGGSLFLQSSADVDIEGFDDVLINGSDDLFLSTNDVTRLFINETGNVGIGSTTPDSRLDVFGDISLTDGNGKIDFKEGTTVKAFLDYNGTALKLENNETNGDIEVDALDDIFLQSGGTTTMFLNQDSDIGIGTTIPTARVEINHNSSLSDAHLELFENADDFARIKFRSNPAGSANDTKYWDVAGRVGTNAQDRFNLYFFNGTSGQNFFSIDPFNNNIRIDGDIIPLSNVQFDIGNNVAGEHWDDIVADDFINFSDRKLKENITSLELVIPELMKLNPVTYTYIESHNPDSRRRTGFVAQEVQKVFPSVVIDEDVDIDVISKKSVRTKSEFLAMNYVELIPIAIKAIQEQQDMISERDLKIQKLESDIETLKSSVAKLIAANN